ncbi:MAG: glycosyltransferase family 9 protein [Rhodospirillales bacterium]|nr:glycosyltransferase family 9 protein [Alphaproteobacteria bacterium]MCB9986073.1 glycosyltransferase family 9 protein [Rhodospirillales bacterium]USO07360.1 MAG: glycosyltransferase family 9 protein [Rhodospirillales bacterium]
MKKILFITATRIGDAVFSMGLLDHMVRTWPQASITVACGPLVEGFFTPVPGVARVIVLKKEKRAGHWRKLWKQVVTTRWDMVVDLRNSAVSRLICAKKRYIFGPAIDRNKHKVEQNAAVMRLTGVPAPRLWFSPETLARAAALVPDGGPVLGVGPAANWLAKTWPADRFIELIDILTGPGGILPGARIAVIAAPGEEAQARPVLDSIPPERRIDLIAKGRPELAAACIARCAFFVGNDSGLTHCAAAAGVPTLGLYGPSWPHIYRPWGQGFVATPKNFAQLIDYPGYDSKTAPCLMEGLSVEMVASAAHDVWMKTARR